MLIPLAFQMPGFAEMLMLAAVGLLLFGKRLPEVGRSLGKGIVEFKKGIRGIEDDIDTNTQRSAPQMSQPTQQQLPPQSQQPYRFDPYTGKPTENSAANSSTNAGATKNEDRPAG